MATTPASIPATVVRGVAATLTGYIISDMSIKESIITEPTQDQLGATVDEQDYDVRYDLRFTALGPDTAPAASGNDAFSFASAQWKVDSCEKVGSYESKQKWLVTAHRFTNYPAQA